MDAVTYQTLRKFSGINNVDLATRLFPIVIDKEYAYPLQIAMNVDIDNTLGISSRDGYDEVIAGTDIHSLWSDGITGFYVDGETLYQTDGITGTIITSGLTLSARMAYAPFNDRIYYSNGHQIGYVKSNAAVHLPAPGREFKEPLPAGKFLAVFKGCLYVAVGNVLYVSDPMCDYYDIRTGYRIFPEAIRMVRPVDDGIYVSDDVVWFLKGKGNDEFERDEAYPIPAIPYTDVVVSGKYIGEGLDGDVAIWTGEDGICLGDNSGKVVNLTEPRYLLTPRGNGSAFIREINNVRHYINTLY